jgi:hypothetical protein
MNFVVQSDIFILLFMLLGGIKVKVVLRLVFILRKLKSKLFYDL